MFRERCIGVNSPEEWRDALCGIPHAFAHTWENCYAMQLTTGFNTYLYCFERDGVRIICPISERPCDRYCDIVTPYGFSGFAGNGDSPEFPSYWREFVREKGYISGYIALNPLFENRTYFDSADVFKSNSLYFLDLTLSMPALYANLDRNRKRQLRAYNESADVLVFEKKELTQFFLTNYDDFIRRIRGSAANYFSQKTLAYLCQLDNVFMVGAREADQIQAVYIFAHTPYAGDCLFNVSLPEGRKWTTMLLWSGLEYLKSIHVPILALGGGSQEDDSVARSKQRYGGIRLPFHCLKQVYRPQVFQELCQRFKAESNRPGYFPPYACPAQG